MRRAFVALFSAVLIFASPGNASAADPRADALTAAYDSMGGRAVLGPILFQAFRRGDDPYLYLATSRLVLQVSMDGGEALPANTMEWLTAAGRDSWLEATRGIPKPVVDTAVYPDIKSAFNVRKVLLTQPDLAAYYLSRGDEAALRLYGLPNSIPERHGPFISQRFQRGALQLWVEAVPGSPDPGTIVSVLAGDLLVEAGLLALPPRAPLPPGVAPGDVLTRVRATDAAAITFDMGSIDTGLQEVLDALSARKLKATFYVTGDFVRRYEWVVPKLLELGHEIGNHTITHPDLTTIGNAAIAREVDNLDVMLTARGAPLPVWFRPPFGAYDRRVQSVLAGRGYPLVMWRLDLADWRDEITLSDVIRNGRRILPGDIVVTHGGLPKTAAAIPVILDEMAARGLRMVTQSELYRLQLPE